MKRWMRWMGVAVVVLGALFAVSLHLGAQGYGPSQWIRANNPFERFDGQETSGAVFEIREGAGVFGFYGAGGSSLHFGTGANAVGTQVGLTQTTVPTATNATVVGTDTAGIVTETNATAWVLTFNGTWAAAPSCIVVRNTGTAANVVQVAATTTTTLTPTIATGVATGDKFNFLCLGIQ